MFSLSSLYTILFLAAFSSTIQSNKFCGTDLDDASDKCWQPCTTDEDCRKCAVDLSCYDTGEACSSLDTTGTNHFYCGTSWCDAAYKCTKPCPNGGWNNFDGVLESECPEGESCFADIPCDSNVAPAPVPELPQPPTSAPFQFCGSSLEDAQTQCWQPCPRGSSDCCFGQECFDTSQNGGSCTSSDYSGENHFYCGSSWCDAAFSCGQPCPSGTNDACPGGQYCYADVPCDSNVAPYVPPQPVSPMSQYCGSDAADAADNCWQPCRDDSDCCFGQTCFSGISCPYPENQGSDHYFCGVDYCGSSFECLKPCKSGFDAECDPGQRCFANTPCNANILRSGLTEMNYGLPASQLQLLRSFRQEGVIVVDNGETTVVVSPDSNNGMSSTCHPPWLATSAYWSGDFASVEDLRSSQRYNYKCINEPFCVNDGIKPTDSKYWVRLDACAAALLRVSMGVGLCTLLLVLSVTVL